MVVSFPNPACLRVFGTSSSLGSCA